MFDPKSRYHGVQTIQVRDARGRTVTIVTTPNAPEQAIAGIHRLKHGQRLDHLAYRYLDDPAGFWRIAEINDAMTPDAIAEVLEVIVPTRSG